MIVSIVVGGIVGWLASLIMKTSNKIGIIGNVIVCNKGSSLGFCLAGHIGLAAYGTVARWIVSGAGAVVMIWILKKLGIFK